MGVAHPYCYELLTLHSHSSTCGKILFRNVDTVLPVEAVIRTWWCWCPAAQSCILTVNTVMVGNSIVGTVYKSCLPAVAEQVVQVNGTRAEAKCRGNTIKRCCTCVIINVSQINFYTLSEKKIYIDKPQKCMCMPNVLGCLSKPEA